MTNLSDTLAALSEAASTAKYWLEHSYRGDLAVNQHEALETLVALGEAYRTGQLVPVPSAERVARAIIVGRTGERAADHAQEFDTANWAEAKRSAAAVIAAMQEKPE